MTNKSFIAISALLAVITLVVILKENPKNSQTTEVAVIEQYSPFTDEWYDVVLFYGYGHNKELAEKYMNAFKPISERPLRIRKATISISDLEQILKKDQLTE